MADWSLESWMVKETKEWLDRYRDSIDRVQLRYQEQARNAMRRVRPLLDHPRPLDPIRELHQQVLEDISALRTNDQLAIFEMVLLSELLCVFPLRSKHWGQMQVTHGRILDSPGTDSLHINDATSLDPSKYAIVVPTSGLKNQETSREVRELDPPRYVYRLPAFVEELVARYLEEARPRLVEPGSPHLFSTASDGTLRVRLQRFQDRFLIGPLGLSRAWGFHPYRVVVATHAVKNAPDRPFLVAASLLLDSELMVRRTYGHFRAEDAHDSARDAISPLGHYRGEG